MRSVVRCILAIMPLFLAAQSVAQTPDSTKPGAPRLQARRAPRPAAMAEPTPPLLSPEAQLALDELSQRFAGEIELIQGWFRDRPVLYYNFGYVREPVTPGRVLWPIHGFDARGNPVAMRGQRPIFSSIPGVGDYSGVWRLAYVVTADHVQPNQLRDVASVEAILRSNRAVLKETNLLVNLPIVSRGSRLARDSTPGMLGWYQGRDVQFFDFGMVSLTPAAMWRFARGLDSLGQPNLLVEQNSIVDSIPVSSTYPDLWEMHVVRADSAYTPNSIKSVGALQRANLVIDPPNGVRNLPIVMIDGTRVERVPSPLRTFADLRSPFPPAPTPPQ